MSRFGWTRERIQEAEEWCRQNSSGEARELLSALEELRNLQIQVAAQEHPYVVPDPVDPGLLPCPFCGGEVRWGDDEGHYQNCITCDRCPMEFTFLWHGNRQKYRDLWNDRKGGVRTEATLGRGPGEGRNPSPG